MNIRYWVPKSGHSRVSVISAKCQKATSSSCSAPNLFFGMIKLPSKLILSQCLVQESQVRSVRFAGAYQPFLQVRDWFALDCMPGT